MYVLSAFIDVIAFSAIAFESISTFTPKCAMLIMTYSVHVTRIFMTVTFIQVDTDFSISTKSLDTFATLY